MNDTSVEGVTHEDAVAALKASKERVRLVIGKPAHSVVDSIDSMPAPVPAPVQNNASSVSEVINSVRLAGLPPRSSPAAKPPVPAPAPVTAPVVPPQQQMPRAQLPPVPPTRAPTTSTSRIAEPSPPAPNPSHTYQTISRITPVSDTSKPMPR